MKRVIEDLRKLSVKPVQQALDDLYEQVCEFTEVPDQQDDITLLGFELT
jgi:serine phosphatase RsbU (regulator of sigma subunit)